MITAQRSAGSSNPMEEQVAWMTERNTPGPWRVWKASDKYGSSIVSDDGVVCAFVPHEPDSRLIACAPKLLACLEKAASSNYHSIPEIAEWILAIREARGIAPTEPKP
jgi:hypothetical protein